MKIFLLSLVASFTFANQSFAQAPSCPLGKNDDHLTIQRVMINWGKFVGGADHVVLLGARYPNETVTDEQIANAANALILAVACAQAILDNPTGDMLPGKASFLQGEELTKYIEDFLYFVEEFREALIHYQASFVTHLNTPREQRDWEALYAESKEINELIDRAHRKTAGHVLTEAMPPAGASLEANMKAYNENMKVIDKSVTDLNLAARNATLADEMVRIFGICKNQIPDDIKKMPEPMRQKTILAYQESVQQGIDLSLKLQQALLARNVQEAQKLIVSLKKLKDDAHDKFDP